MGQPRLHTGMGMLMCFPVVVTQGRMPVVYCSLHDLTKGVVILYRSYRHRNRRRGEVGEERCRGHGFAGAKPRGFCGQPDMLKPKQSLPGETTACSHQLPWSEGCSQG